MPERESIFPCKICNIKIDLEKGKHLGIWTIIAKKKEKLSLAYLTRLVARSKLEEYLDVEIRNKMLALNMSVVQSLPSNFLC